MAHVTNVAKYFISLSEESTPHAITPLKLQKLIYYAQGFFLSENPEPLFEEDLVAWDHGPVNREIYDKYKKYGYFTIPKEQFTNENGDLSDIEKQTINTVWNEYGHLDGKFLEELTHQEDPWVFTDRNHVIDIDLIREYFEQQLGINN